MNKEKGQRGAALVVALLVVLVLSLLEIALIVTTTTESKVSSTQLRDTQALTVAEAGIEEVISRMLLASSEEEFIGDADVPLNPDWCTIVTLDESSGSGDTTWVETVQKGQYKLQYATRDETGPPEDFLSVRHKTGGTNGDSIYFGREQILEAPGYDGDPVQIIEVTGRKGEAKRRIITEVVKSRPTVTIEAAMRVNSGVRVGGTMDVCGHDHTLDFWDEVDNYEPPGCSLYHAEPCITPWPGTEPYWDKTHHLCYDAGCMGAVVCEPPFEQIGTADIYGNPALDTIPGSEFLELYEILGFTSEGEMMSATSWETVEDGDEVHGFCVYEGGGTFTPSGNWGNGVLWIKGDFRLQSHYDFRGLIYIENTGKFHGTCNVLGTVLVKADYDDGGGSGTPDIFLSTETVKEEVEHGMSYFVQLSWREKP